MHDLFYYFFDKFFSSSNKGFTNNKRVYINLAEYPGELIIYSIFIVGTKYNMSVSVQEMVRPSEAVDLYYYDAETSKKQAFATTQNTKYVQQFAK